jgi:tRNA dimethylallyltransferase
MTVLNKSNLITILGPTASGKTALGVKLCNHFNGEIISADSRQVYRGMDIGTGKDLDEYQNTPYHLIDVVEPTDEFNVFTYSEHFVEAFCDINQRNKLAFLVGGTGMYLDAILNRYELTIAKIDRKARQELENKSESELIELLSNFDKNLHNSTDLTERSRIIRAIEIAEAEKNKNDHLLIPEFQALTIGIRISREEIKSRITTRLKARFDEGMIEEVESLYKNGVDWDKLHFFGLEYRYIAQYLKGEINYNDMFQKLNSAIHTFAKQQNKWFRNIEKKGHVIHWLDADDELEENARQLISSFLA